MGEKGQEETFEDDGYVYSLGCDDGFMGVDICKNCTLQIHTVYVNSMSVKLFLKLHRRFTRVN